MKNVHLQVCITIQYTITRIESIFEKNQLNQISKNKFPSKITCYTVYDDSIDNMMVMCCVYFIQYRETNNRHIEIVDHLLPEVTTNNVSQYVVFICTLFHQCLIMHMRLDLQKSSIDNMMVICCVYSMLNKNSLAIKSAEATMVI